VFNYTLAALTRQKDETKPPSPFLRWKELERHLLLQWEPDHNYPFIAHNLLPELSVLFMLVYVFIFFFNMIIISMCVSNAVHPQKCELNSKTK
jgi:hypothetical protein